MSEEYLCQGKNCKRPERKITWGEYNYSMAIFGKPLCVDCQMIEREKQNPKLGRFINNQIRKERREYAESKRNNQR